MDQELDGVGSAPKEGQTPDQPGGQPGSGAQPAGNWDNDPNVRKMKSGYDKRIADLERQVQQSREQVENLLGQVDSSRAQAESLQQFVSQFDPQALDEFQLQAEIDQVLRRNEQLERNEQQRQAQAMTRKYHLDAARNIGVDPYDPRYQAAIDAGDTAGVQQRLAEMYAEKVQADARRPEPPAAPAAAPPPAAAQAAPQNVVLPGGGSPPLPNDVAERVKQAREARAEALRSGDKTQVLAFRDTYQDVLHLLD